MSLDSDDVNKVADLARLQLEPDQVTSYAQELSGILDMVDKLEAVDTAGVTPMSHPLDLSARLREDAVTETDQREAFQATAPATADGLYLVPRVIE